MYLSIERQTLERYIPGLDAILAETPMGVLEDRKTGLLPRLFKQSGAAGLVVPRELGGQGCSALDTIRIQRAVGSRCPSLAVMLTMHNFTVGFCARLEAQVPAVSEMLRAVANESLLVASGFAEGRPGAGILDSTMYLTHVNGGYRISGSKKPCSLTHCMDILTAGVALKDADGNKRTGMAIISASTPGIKRQHFWNSSVLAAADSHEVVLEDVFVSQDRVIIADGTDEQLEQSIRIAEIRGLSWFQLLVTSSYLGIASALLERVFNQNKGDLGERTRLFIELENAMTALEAAAHWLEMDQIDEALLPKMLVVRLAAQSAIERSSILATELLGGLSFITAPEIGYLYSASRALAFHPIGRKAAEPLLMEYATGQA